MRYSVTSSIIFQLALPTQSNINTALHDCKADTNSGKCAAQECKKELFRNTLVGFLLREVVNDKEGHADEAGEGEVDCVSPEIVWVDRWTVWDPLTNINFLVDIMIDYSKWKCFNFIHFCLIL